MKKLLKRMILGTALEPVARKVRAAFTPGGASRSAQYDIQTIAVMKRVLASDSNCIDVGCHQGAILRHMLRLAPRGTLLAFEPIPAMCEVLKRTFGNRSNVRIYQIALSDRAVTTSFHHVVSRPGFSGLHRRDNDREQIAEISVETELLDALVPAVLPIRFIKVDVEGAELQVLRGGVETIRMNRPVIVFEHGLGGADYFGTKPEDIYDLLVGQCQLKLFLMADWLANGAPALSREAFREEFFSRRNYYFMAHP
jgi:FkbM family methyltransferase